MNNKIQLIGRLSEDIDIFGKGVATLTVVPFDDYANQEPQFIQVKIFEKTYKNRAPYLLKGKSVALEGHIAVNNYTDSKGVKQFRQDLVVDRITYLSGKTKAQLAEEEAVKAPAKKATKKSAK